MADDSMLLDLVARWEAARESGNPLSPEELCASSPELLEELRSAIVKLHGHAAITVSLPSADDTQPHSPSQAAADRIKGYDKFSVSVNLVSSVEPSPPRSGRQPGTSYQPGDQVAGFTLLREIGSGGFGQVFETEDAVLRRRVAIKFLHSKALANPRAREQFLSEARAMAAISNDHVVPIYQVGQDGENLFLVMPLLAGETLASKLQRDGILPLSEFLRLARELASGLSAIHAKGLIHRDLKPANIWLEAGSGRVKVLDLGLADEVANLREGGSAGTPAYMSPEQIEGDGLDFRSDLFSLGAIFYECLTARKAFPGKTISETVDAVLRARPLPLAQANPATPLELRELITAMLQKDRTQRPVSAQAVLEVLPSAGDASTRSAVFPQPLTTTRRVPWLLLAVVAPLLLVLVVIAVWKWPSTPPSVATTSPTAPPTQPPAPLTPLTIDELEVTPLQQEMDNQWKELQPLSKSIDQRVTMANAIDVKVKLSRPAYSYIVLYRADGESVLLYPRRADEEPPLSAEPAYPPRGEDVAYLLNDAAGVWAVSVIASSAPLPSYRDWQASHPPAPWTEQRDPTALSSVVMDDGDEWTMPKRGGGVDRGNRGEITIARRVPIKPLLDFWKEARPSAVKVLAFRVLEK